LINSNKLKALLQYPLPHHLISRVVFHGTQIPHPFTTSLIRWFVAKFGVELEEAAETSADNFRTFNEFFTRELAPGARPLCGEETDLVWPADGRISRLGDIESATIVQAKGHDYSVESLIANPEWSDRYSKGSFATVYLSPKDYHRVHIPASGTLMSMTHVPGRLFSVAPHTVDNVPNLFARNERVVAHFETAAGAMAVVWVGALNVGAIETVWAGLVTPGKAARIPGAIWFGRRNKRSHLHASSQEYEENESSTYRYNRGDEIGRFNMGSTVIVLTEQRLDFTPLISTGDPVSMGQIMGSARK